MYTSGKLVIAGHAPAFDRALAIVESVGKPVIPKSRPAPGHRSAPSST